MPASSEDSEAVVAQHPPPLLLLLLRHRAAGAGDGGEARAGQDVGYRCVHPLLARPIVLSVPSRRRDTCPDPTADGMAHRWDREGWSRVRVGGAQC